MQRLRMTTLLLLTVLLVMPSALSAQEMRVVTGRVTVEDTQEPLAGTRVAVKGTVIATVTDARGYFSLRVPDDAETLVFTFLGYRTEEAPISDQVDVIMSVAPIGLEGIVVTALGITREKRSLGYSVQDLTGDEITEVPKLNLVNTMQGNVAGVHITNAGPTGGSSRIVIRGANSIDGQNQPLFIVDGIPLDNWSRDNAGYGGIDYGNTIQDLDPANIESLSVLKGPNAAALYGSRAANGVVLITTKSGRGTQAGRLGVTVNISATAETPLRLPDYQNLYGQGYSGQFQWVDGGGGGTFDYFDESWGPRLDTGARIDQFTGANQPWVSHPNNVKDFFRTGGTLNTNVAASYSSERGHVRLSITDTRLNGVAPATTLHRVGLALKGGVGITERLSADASLNYIDNASSNRMGTGYDEDNPMQSFIWFGRQVDMEALRNFRCVGGGPPEGPEPTPCIPGGQYNWNYNYHNNPFWEMYVNGNADERDRLFFNTSLSYQLTDWITVTGQVGRDWYRFHRKRVRAPHSLDDAGEGSFDEQTEYRAETNWDLILTGTRQLTSDFSLDVTAGGNIRNNMYEGSGVSVSRLTAPDIYSIDNAAVTPTPWDYNSKSEVRSLYGAVTVGFRGWLTLDLTGRNDWSSTLPEGENSYFYPSISTSWLFGEAFGLRSSLFSSGKLRASWTRVGNDAGPYQLVSTMSASTPWGGTPMFSVPNRLANAELKPEETTAFEIGTDLGFFNERMGFVLTFYQSQTKNQIMGVQISRATGYSEQMLNAGEVRNRGWELLLRANPLRSNTGLNWDLTVNWAKNSSEVTELYGDLESLLLGRYWSVNIEARKGEPYGVLFGNPLLRCHDEFPAAEYPDSVGWQSSYTGCTADRSDMLILTTGGNTRQDPTRRVLGNYNPDWIGGMQNRFSLGRWDLSILFQGQVGGEIFSVTDYFGQYAGVLQKTIPGRETDWNDPGVLVRGILPDSTINGEDGVDVRVVAQDYYEGIWGKQEVAILDATYLKLRELRIGYDLPNSWVRWMGFNGGNVSLIGRNLFLWSKCDNIDPETAFDASNAQGIEFGQHPSTRSYGFSLALW
jgi:TonB-linked SusC/RagA family outer membrane protein